MAQAITREEQYLAAMANGSTTDIKPVTREEMYLAKATGQNVTVPKPVTRKEMFLQRVALNGGGTGGGGGTSATLIEKPITANGTYNASADGADGYSKVVVNVPNVIPDDYIKPSGTLPITENGIHDVTEYASVSVNVASSGGGDTLKEVLRARGNNCANLFFTTDGYADDRTITTVPYFDTSEVTNMNRMFYRCAALTSVPLFDTSKVTDMSSMFNGCSALTSVPEFDTRNVKLMVMMFNSCSALTEIPLFDTSNVTNMNSMFRACYALTSVPQFNTSNVKNMSYMFNSCSALTEVPMFDTRNVTNMSGMLDLCGKVTEIRLKNIITSLQVSDGTSYGHLLTVDSLIHLIYELRKQSSTKTLTVGSANLEKLANVYVKAIDITDDMRAEDDLINEKYPFVVCESTDEGAMLITDYASTIKNWTIK